MRINRVLARGCSFLLAALILTLAPAAYGQRVRIPRQALLNTEAVRQAVAEGQRLEQSNNWADALTHYERAVKRLPGHPELEQRLRISRTRFNLSRRYGDQSYVQRLTTLTPRKALDVYNEILAKIQLHYVVSPSWDALVDSGMDGAVVALRAKEFRRQHVRQANDVEIESAIRAMREELGPRRERSRLDAEISASIAADLLKRKLGVSESAVILEFACNAANHLDDYSAFLTPDQYEDVMSQIEGNFVGLGIELKADKGALLIVNVIRGGPADRGGIRTGDRIVQVDRQVTRTLSTDAAADLLRGVDGSQVDLMVLRPGRDDPDRVRLLRRRVEVPSIEDVRIVDKQHGVGYLRLTSFQKTTTEELDNALWDLHNQGMRSLVVDVRGNPGGLLPASVQVADRFVSKGVIVSTRGRSSGEDLDYRAHAVGTWRVPLIVLIDADSASASEIFAGAIRDHRRGVVIGQRSYGKGSVQGIFPLLGSQAGIRLTTAKFYSPNGRPISKNGVQPDVAVQVAARPTADGAIPADHVLDHAVEYARTRLQR